MGDSKSLNPEVEYVNSVFDALMNYQCIEELLKECILRSYEILEKTSTPPINFKVKSETKKSIKNRMGLGGLVGKFRELTTHQKLCDKIKSLVKERNKLAHVAAADYLKHPISQSGNEEILKKAKRFRELTEKVNKLYYELHEVHAEIMQLNGKII